MDFGNAAQIASALVSLLAMVIAIVSARSKGNKDAIEAARNEAKGRFDQWEANHRAEAADLFTRMRRVEEDVSALKNEIEHLPNKEMAHRLDIAIEALKGQVGLIDAKLQPVAAMASRMQDLLLERHRNEHG